MSLSHRFILSFLILSLSFRIPRLVIAVRNARQQGQGQRTAKPIFWVMTFSYLIFLGFCVDEAWHTSHWVWAVTGVGMTLYILALLLRERAMKDLGRFFSPDVEIRQRHQVVQEGLYGVVRHPLLSCMILEVLGVGILLNAYWALLFLGGGFYFPVLAMRKSVEEKALVNALGEDYRTYQKNVGAFWPKWHSIARTEECVNE